MQYWFNILLKSQGNRIYIGVFWAYFTALSGIALLMLSGWFITATAITGLSIGAGLVVLFDMYMPGSGIRFFALSRTVGRYIERIYNHDSILRLISVFRLRLFEGLSTMPIAALRKTSDSEWLSKLTADLDALDSILLRYIIPPITALLIVLSLTFFLGFFWFELAIYLGCFMLLCLVITIRASIKYTKEFAIHASSLLNQSRNDIIEHLQGTVELQSVGLMQHHESKICQRLEQFYIAQNSLNTRVANIQLILDLTLGLAFTALICALLFAVNSTLIDGPVAIMLVMMFMGASEVLQSMPSQFSMWGKTHFCALRLTGLLDKNEPHNGATLDRIDNIEVQIQRNPRIAISQEKTLQFLIKDSHLVNIQGRSGSGKSTVANLLIGAEPATKNDKITINSHINLNAVSATNWYQQLCYLEQSNAILAGTLGYNLALGLETISEQEVWSVLKIVELDEWASALPDGLNYWLGETGGKVSGGQGRRICLARLLLRDPQLVILDEPFDGIDDTMAARIWHNMRPWISSRMVVLLTHERPAYFDYNQLVKEISLDSN